MTTTLKIKRFNLRNQESQPPADAVVAPVSQHKEGAVDKGLHPDTNPDRINDEIESIRREGLSARQLRTARRLAKQQELRVTSDLDAVRQLRAQGIDPFQETPLLQIVADGDTVHTSGGSMGTPDTAQAQPNIGMASAAQGASAQEAAPDDGPIPVTPINIPTGSPAPTQNINYAADIMEIQRDITRRRRRKSRLLTLRLLIFVMLPTILCGIYYTYIATPLYATNTEFVIQQAAPAGAGAAAASGGSMLSGTQFATAQDSIAVQGYLQSRDAMLRLDKDRDYIGHFSAAGIDMIQRLPDDVTIETAYKAYQKNVKISYDPTEGIIRLEVLAVSPQKAEDFATALIGYAEEQVDHLTQRLREDQMSGAREAYDQANLEMIAAQRKVVDLQQKFKVLSSEVEISLISNQLSQLQTQLNQDRLSLAQMQSNERPNQARMAPLERRIETITTQIAGLRSRLTEGQNGAESLAEVQSEMLVAQADVETRRIILAQAVQSMENARQEANRQVRYLSISVAPIPPDEPAYPKAFENTLVALLIFSGIYLMISMTIAILREQISS